MSNSKKPNIIFIILDSARRDYFGCYGNTEGLTPNIDKLAKKSLLMNDHYAAGCGSAQAHVSIFLGQHSYRHGVVHNMSEMHSDVVALPKLLREYGYKTYGHCMASFIPPAGYEDLFGFDEFYYPGKIGTSVKRGFKNRIQEKFRKYPKLWTLLKKSYIKLRGSESLVKRSAACFDGKKSLEYLLSKLLITKETNHPAFAYTTLLHPHTPYYPPKWCIDKVFKGEKINKQAFDIHLNMHSWVNGDLGDAPEAIESLKKLYKAELLYADYLVGQFVKQLKENDLFDNSLFIVTSDHGEMFADHGQLNHGATVWEEIYRLPMLINFPQGDQVNCQINNNITSGLDIYPTIMEYIGCLSRAKDRTTLDGQSIVQSLGSGGHRNLVVDAPPLVLPERLKQYPTVIAKGSIFYRAVRNRNYKYIWQSNGVTHLYKVGDREIEENNIVKKEESIAHDMHNEMLAFYRNINQNFEIDQYPINMGASAASKMTNPLIVQELKKLGYM